MAKYIDVGKAIEAICKEYPKEKLCNGKAEAVAILEDMPAADVEPIKCGQWEMLSGRDAKNLFNNIFRCSECGAQTPEGAYPIAPDYCPHCGADMMRRW